MTATFVTVDEYVASFPDDVRPTLAEIATTIRRAMPGADERIRYGMPAFMLDGREGLHFAGWKHHVGLYPVPVLGPQLEAELAPYRTHKDTVRFLYRDPIPFELIDAIARTVASRP